MEQITYPLFIRRLDDAQTLEESRALMLKRPMESRVVPNGKDARGRSFGDLRWSRFKNFAPAEMYTVVGEHVFSFLRALGGQGSSYASHMKVARFTIPMPGLLAKVVDMLDLVPMDDCDTKGDLYEYMLGKIAAAVQSGQFRTPRHIIKQMVAMTQPTPEGRSISALQEAVEGHALPLHLLPEKFTLTELQRICKAVLNKALDKGVLRRRLCTSTDLVEVEGEFVLGAQRPAQLYLAADGFQFR